MTVILHPRILELVASRICHDLVSPVGAISNGIELMQELGEGAGDEASALVATSAAQAAIRLKCFRLAYGAAGTDKNIGLRDVREVFADWLKAGKITAEFEPGLEVKFSMPPRGFFKCMLNLLMFAEECTRGEGRISATALEGNKGIRLLAAGRQAGFRDEMSEAALKGDIAPEDLDPRSVHAYITGKFAAYFGFTLAHEVKADSGLMEFRLSF